MSKYGMKATGKPFTEEEIKSLRHGDTLYSGEDRYWVVENDDGLVTIQDPKFHSRACYTYAEIAHYFTK